LIETLDLEAPKAGAGRIVAVDTNQVKDELARGAIVFPSL